MALTKATLIDLNSNELILDLDADTSITADTDDTIHFKIAGADEIVMTGTAFTPAVADGSALGSTALEWSDLFLADGAVVNFGADQDVTLTHVADTGLLLNSTSKLQFNDASQFIQGASATVLDIAATDEIELTATLIDVVGNLTVSGTIVSTGTITGTLATAAQGNITSLGTLTTLTVDDITINGSTISDAGDLTIDVAGDIVLDAGGADIILKDDGTQFGKITNGSTNISIFSGTTLNTTMDGANITFAGTIDSGAITSTGIVTGTGFTAGNAVLAEAELELLDGLTAGTAIASKVVTTDANIDSTGMRNLTISGELDAATGDFSGAVDVAGAITSSAGATLQLLITQTHYH